jgi:hypothetical protein
MLDRVIHSDDPPTLATFAKVIYTIRAGQVILAETAKAHWAWSASILAARMTLAQFSISALMRVECLRLGRHRIVASSPNNRAFTGNAMILAISR